jgi:hypothetical protein
VVGQDEIHAKAGGKARRVVQIAGQPTVHQGREDDQVEHQGDRRAGLSAPQLAQEPAYCAHAPVTPRHVAVQHERHQCSDLKGQRPGHVWGQVRVNRDVKEADVD